MDFLSDMVDNKEDCLEIMEFVIGHNVYGINVAKVREIVQYSEPTPSPDQHPCVEGILMLRGTPIPIINLEKRLNLSEKEVVYGDPEDVRADEEENSSDRELFIISSFNNLVIGLHVHRINGIKKLSWSDIESPDETITKHGNCIITGIVNKGEKILVLLDFEKIVADINPITTIRVEDVKTSNEKEINAPIMIVDDSLMLNNLIYASLSKAGYRKIIRKNNGKEAYDYIMSYADKNNITDYVAAVISDIEMPVMDGLTLCKKLKQDVRLQIIPVIMFSSIIDDSMRIRCEDAGANNQLSKPEIGKLVEILENYV